MAQHDSHRGSIMPQQTNFDNADQPGISQPYSQSEIEDLLYGEERPASERLARLREMRDEARARESGDLGEDDPAALLEEIDRAIDELSATMANAEDIGAYAGLDTSFDSAPEDRLDLLSPDDEEARQAIEGDEDSYVEDDEDALLDEPEWDGGAEFRPDPELH